MLSKLGKWSAPSPGARANLAVVQYGRRAAGAMAAVPSPLCGAHGEAEPPEMDPEAITYSPKVDMKDTALIAAIRACTVAEHTNTCALRS